MSQAVDHIDWHLLHRQKLVLLGIRNRFPQKSPEHDALSGVIHLLDALQDDAVETGRWAYPGDCTPD
jgi:hypothetical protein